MEQLSVIETLVRNMQAPSSLSEGPASSSRTQLWQSLLAPAATRGSNSSDTDRVMISFNLDASFKAATDKILQWPIFERLLSSCQRFQFIDFYGAETYTYLDDLFTQPRPSTSLSPGALLTEPNRGIHISNEREDIEVLVDRFFNRVNNKNPILSRRIATQYCQRYYEDGPRFDLEACIVLLACALGAVAMEYSPPDATPSPATPARFSSTRLEDLQLGRCYFAAAEKRLGPAMTEVSTLAIQCLCLAGIYHMFTLRPMQASRMFHDAGSSLRILMSTNLNTPQETYQLYLKLFWVCSNSERELLAELPVNPPSLTGPGTPDAYPLPPRIENIGRDEWSVHEEDSWYFFLSEIALRRIAHQVSEVVAEHITNRLNYNESPDIQELVPIVAEFEHQVHTFREQLPHAMQFPDVPELASTEWQQYTRGRYYRVLELMHRPFLFTALHDPNCGPVVHTLAEKSLFNALKYLEHSHTNHRHHGTWLQLRNQLKETSLLLAASKVNGLAMPEGWEAGVSKSLSTFDYWLQEFPSCKTYTSIILTLANGP
ncbi:unnamed protein product [Clonostachys solani]|uniref:Xylanolytic transcriptional activator regulatory domain-containing protein n=1 Tax=Clonostachys solani TaxID=160281 RepID=A0A9P0EQF0_9HYPO|nr:unnamed protein product [Clonostachys solani]